MGETTNWPETDYCPHQHGLRLVVPLYVVDVFPASNTPPEGAVPKLSELPHDATEKT